MENYKRIINRIRIGIINTYKAYTGLLVQKYVEIERRGLLGKKRQIEGYIGRGERCSVDFNEIRSRIDEINRSYMGVRLWENCGGVRIGEWIPLYVLIACKNNEETSKYLNIMVDSNYDCPNSALESIASRNIPVITKSNARVWNRILCGVNNIDYTHFAFSRYDEKTPPLFDSVYPLFGLTKEEKEYGEEKKRIMGLDSPFVCLSSRDSTFLESLRWYYNTKDFSYQNHRDSDFSSRKLLIDYLSSEGIASVRMGKVVKQYYDFPHCIEYARDYYDELLDVYLFQECKFAMVDTNGLIVLPLCNNGNVVYTNLTPVFGGMGGIPIIPNGIILYKKMFSRKLDRFLTLYEMVEADFVYGLDGNRFMEAGIDFVENTAEELLDAAIEMNERIDGKWKETEESLERQNRFNCFREEMIKKYSIPEGHIPWVRVCDSFLKNNWSIFGL